MGSDEALRGGLLVFAALAAAGASAAVTRLMAYAAGGLIERRRAGRKAAPPALPAIRPARPRRPPLAFAFIALSVGVAAGSFALILALRLSAEPSGWLGAAYAGLAAGLAVGLAPAPSGAVLVAAAVSISAIALVELRAYHPLEPGVEMARLVVVAADAGGTRVELALPRPNALPILQSLELPPGALGFSVLIIRPEGLAAAFLPSRYYRLSAIEVDGREIPFGAFRSSAEGSGPLGLVAKAVGFAPRLERSRAVEPEDFMRLELSTGPGGGLSLAEGP